MINPIVGHNPPHLANFGSGIPVQPSPLPAPAPASGFVGSPELLNPGQADPLTLSNLTQGLEQNFDPSAQPLLPANGNSNPDQTLLQLYLAVMNQLDALLGPENAAPVSNNILGSSGANSNFSAPTSPVSSSSGGSSGGFSPSSSGSVGSAAPSGSSASPASASSGSTETESAEPITELPPNLAKNDKAMAQFIDKKLQGTPLAGQKMGAHFVKAGKDNKVDPLTLVAISRHETNHGKLGVGVVKHMGVGAFDSSPSKARQWDGAVNQIYSGAKTFANLRQKGGSNANAPLASQLSAVNKAGWATDSSWHQKVGKHRNEISRGAN